MMRIAAIATLCASAAAAQQPDSVFAVSRSGQSLLRVNADGNVGIGDSAPGQRLSVRGGVKADSVTVRTIRVDSVVVVHIRQPNGQPIFGVPATITPTTEPGWNGYAVSGVGNTSLVIFKDAQGVVHMSGGVSVAPGVIGGMNSPAFVLPVG